MFCTSGASYLLLRFFHNRDPYIGDFLPLYLPKKIKIKYWIIYLNLITARAVRKSDNIRAFRDFFDIFREYFSNEKLIFSRKIRLKKIKRQIRKRPFRACCNLSAIFGEISRIQNWFFNDKVDKSSLKRSKELENGLSGHAVIFAIFSGIFFRMENKFFLKKSEYLEVKNSEKLRTGILGHAVIYTTFFGKFLEYKIDFFLKRSENLVETIRKN